MSRFSQLATALAMTAIALPAFADTTTYEFTAKNASKGPMMVSVDGKVACSVDAGKSCRLSLTNEDATLSYSLAGGPSMSFTTGNIEAADICNIDTTGAHCMTSGRSSDKLIRCQSIMIDTEVVTLWRPVGPEELELIQQSGMKAFPPRLPDQPIFYPVLSEAYATKIARDWNVPRSGSGYVTRFSVRKSFLDGHKIQEAGGRSHLEYWIPAEDLLAFNNAIVGQIEVTAIFP